MNNLPAMLARAFTTSTRTAKSAAWDIADEIIAFRSWGTSETFYFPAGVTGLDEWLIGSSSKCDLCLKDPGGGVSREHAAMSRVDGQWQINDKRSKNGLSVDGVRRVSARIDPGSVLGLGNLQLVAVSCRLIALREFLLRIMGWSVQSNTAIDEAIQDIRIARTRRDPLVLRGPGNLVEIARQLSSVLLEKDAPFALHDTLRSPDGDGDARCVPNTGSLKEAITLAPSGVVCIRGKKLPPDFAAQVLELRMTPKAAPLLIVCDEGTMELNQVRTAPPIMVPACSARSAREMDSLIAACRAEVALEFSIEDGVSDEEYRWIVDNAETIAAVEKCVRRLFALRKAGSTSGAARLLGMAAVSLRRWLQRHPLPPPPKATKGGKPR
jgi:hypothetical protein